MSTPSRLLLEGFQCMDCPLNTSEIEEYYMVYDALWEAVVPRKNGMLCIGCLEKRLGRSLTPFDFTQCPVNEGCFGMSGRMRDRLNGITP